MTNEFQQEIEEERSKLRKDIKETGGNCAKILLILAISTYGIEFAVMFIIRLINIILATITRGNFNSNTILNFSKDYREDFMETAIEDTMVLKTFEKVKASFSGTWAIGYMLFYGVFIVATTLITNMTKIK